MKKIILSLLCLLVISTASNPTSARPKIKTGIEVLKSQHVPDILTLTEFSFLTSVGGS